MTTDTAGLDLKALRYELELGEPIHHPRRVLLALIDRAHSAEATLAEARKYSVDRPRPVSSHFDRDYKDQSFKFIKYANHLEHLLTGQKLMLADARKLPVGVERPTIAWDRPSAHLLYITYIDHLEQHLTAKNLKVGEAEANVALLIQEVKKYRGIQDHARTVTLEECIDEIQAVVALRCPYPDGVGEHIDRNAALTALRALSPQQSEEDKHE